MTEKLSRDLRGDTDETYTSAMRIYGGVAWGEFALFSSWRSHSFSYRRYPDRGCGLLCPCGLAFAVSGSCSSGPWRGEPVRSAVIVSLRP